MEVLSPSLSTSKIHFSGQPWFFNIMNEESFHLCAERKYLCMTSWIYYGKMTELCQYSTVSILYAMAPPPLSLSYKFPFSLQMTRENIPPFVFFFSDIKQICVHNYF